jgi:hypothetical protein
MEDKNDVSSMYVRIMCYELDWKINFGSIVAAY